MIAVNSLRIPAKILLVDTAAQSGRQIGGRSIESAAVTEAVARAAVRPAWWRREILWLLLALAVGAGFRIARSGFENPTFDELWHLELSTGRGSLHASLPEDVLIPAAPAATSLAGAPAWPAVWPMRGAVHPPLYFLVLRAWRETVGSGEAAARALSILGSLAAIALLFRAVHLTSGPPAAAWAALLFAVSPTQVWIGQQVRGYALLQAVGMAAVLALVRLERRPRAGAFAALGLGVLALMLTHYFAIGGALAIGIYALVRLRGRARAGAVAALALAALVYAVVWGPFLWAQREYAFEADAWLLERSPEHVWLTFRRLAAWPGRLAASYRLDTPWPYLSAALLVVPPFLLRRRPGLLLWWLQVAGVLGFLAALDLLRGTGHLRFARYSALAAPAAFALFTASLSALPSWLRHGAPALVLLLALAFSRSMYAVEEPGWPRLGRILDERARPGEALLFYRGQAPEWYADTWYLGASHYARGFPRPIVRLSRAATPALLQELPGRTAWLLAGPLGPGDASRVLPGASVLEQHDVPGLVSCIRLRLPARKSPP